MKRNLKSVALILAAGFSSRMGEVKALLPLGSSTLLEQALYRFRAAGIDDVRVVVGHKADEIAPILSGMGLRMLINPDYQRGMLSSILTGVQSLEPDVEAFFVLPVDIPLVKPATIERLFEVFRDQRPAIAYPRLEGLRGHPPLVSVGCLTEQPPWDYAGGLKAFLERFEADALDVDVIDEGILMDCDTPADHRRLQARFSAQELPRPAECRALWAWYATKDDVIAHSRKVAELVSVLATELNRRGWNFNRDLLFAAGLLHDIAKGRRNHAQKGAELLKAWGYPAVAALVACHTDLPYAPCSLGETELFYLADKLVRGERRVMLEERFKGPLQRFAGQPEILEAVQRRYAHARTVQGHVEKILGRSLEEILQNQPTGKASTSA